MAKAKTHENFLRYIEDHGEDDRVIDDRDEIVIVFDYPLAKPVQRSFQSPGGFTRGTFASAVGKGYADIYAEEEETREASPKPQGILMNRSKTDGVHGIWGHDLADLTLEGAYRDSDGLWHLEVGS